MPCSYPLVQTKFKLPETLIKEYKIEIISENGAVESLYIDDNHQRFVKHKINRKANKIRFVPIKSWGCDELRLFDFEIC